jgi:hypothetical protein
MRHWHGQQSPWAGATPARTWAGGYGAFGAFGLVVPTPLPGNPSYAPNMKAQGYSYCGSKFGMQQMLQDLGYYTGTIDGKVGTGTIAAMKAFGNAHGVPITGSLSNAWCQKLMDVWQAKMQPPAAPAPAPVPPPPAGRPNGQPPSNGGPVATPGNGNGVTSAPGNGNGVTPVAPGAGPIDKAKAWWNEQSTGVKAAIGIGGVAIVGLIIYALVGGKKKATPNRRRYRRNRKAPKRLTTAQQTALSRIRGKRARAKTGKIKTLKSGKRYGHLKPPKRYYKMGAKRPSDYADPEHYKYPLVFRGPSGKVNTKRTKAHIRAAQSYFAKHKRKYPMGTRRKIASRINKAKKQYGVGGKVVKA